MQSEPLHEGRVYRQRVGLTDIFGLVVIGWAVVACVQLLAGRVGLPGGLAALLVVVGNGVTTWWGRAWIRVNQDHIELKNRFLTQRRVDRSRVTEVTSSGRAPVLILKNGDVTKVSALHKLGRERELAELLSVPLVPVTAPVRAQLVQPRRSPTEERWGNARATTTIAVLVAVVAIATFAVGRSSPPDRDSEGLHSSPAVVLLEGDRFYGIWPRLPSLFELTLGLPETTELEGVSITPPDNNRPLFVERVAHSTGETVGRFRTSQAGQYAVVVERAGPTAADCIVGTNCIASLNDALPDFSIGMDPRVQPTKRSRIYLVVGGVAAATATVAAGRLQRIRRALPEIAEQW